MGTPSLLEQLDQLGLDHIQPQATPTEEAFEEALQICLSHFPEDEVRAWMNGKLRIDDVSKEVNRAKELYENRTRCKARKWLTRLSARISVYGSVLDVLAQHHPEYVALAWGALKFVVVGVMNHEELAKELAKALCRIGDALPQAELHLILYPTATMKTLVTDLYVQIIKFARRARKWYSESRLKHVASSIVRPFSLRFQDMTENINELSRRLERLALTLSMAELRKTRLELEKTNQKLDTYHTIQHAGLVDTNRRVCEIQFSQLMAFASASAISSPEVSRDYFVTRRNRSRRKGLDSTPFFQNMPQLLAWGSATESSQLAVCGGFSHRQTIRDFAVNAIDLIMEAQIPVVWALHLPQSQGEFTSGDVIKYLISQVLRKNHTLLNERSLSLNAARFQSATSTEEWFSLLGAVLEGLPQAYFIIDLEFLGQENEDGSAWSQLFVQLFEGLRQRGTRTILKVAFLGSRSSHRSRLGKFDQRRILQLPSSRTGRVSKLTEGSRSRRTRVRGGRILQPASLAPESPGN